MNILKLSLEQEFYMIAGIFILAFLVQMYYYLYLFTGIFKKQKEKRSTKIPVSVVICARNEAENLSNNLPSILEQDYPEFEVLVVNDCSEDDTDFVLGEFKRKYKNLRITSIPLDKKFTHGKKLALTVGLKGAKFDWVLLTDADCKPASNKWIKTMAGQFKAPNEIVVGYGGYERYKGLLNKIIRFDTLFIALHYLGFANRKKPYMGVGRNLAYKKSLFFANRGFASHNHINSGDDDLFVNQVSNRKNTAVVLHPDSITLSMPKLKWGEWLQQKKRHLTSAKYYKNSTKFLLSGEILSRFFFYVFFVLLLMHKTYVEYVFGLFFIRFLIQMIIFKTAMKHLKEKFLLLISPLLDIFIPVINLGLIFANYFSGNKNKWK